MYVYFFYDLLLLNLKKIYLFVLSCWYMWNFIFLEYEFNELILIIYTNIDNIYTYFTKYAVKLEYLWNFFIKKCNTIIDNFYNFWITNNLTKMFRTKHYAYILKTLRTIILFVISSKLEKME